MIRPPAMLLVSVVVLGVLCGANLMLLARHMEHAIAAGQLAPSIQPILLQRAMFFLVTALPLALIALRSRWARFAVPAAFVWIALAPVLPQTLGWKRQGSPLAGIPVESLGGAVALIAYVTLALWIAWVFATSQAVARYFDPTPQDTSDR